MLRIEIPPRYETERRYVLDVLLGEWLGLAFEVERGPGPGVCLRGDDGRELWLADGLFAVPEDQWRTEASLPETPLRRWQPQDEALRAALPRPDLPVVYGDDPGDPDFLRTSERRIDLGLDIFGTAFLLLSRLEEAVLPDRDAHDRFPARASLAFREGFLDRPIVNEYLEVLWQLLHRLWPGLERRPREFRMLLSHDVDEPFRHALTGPLVLARRFAGDLVRRRSPAEAVRSVGQWLTTKLGDPRRDPCFNFEAIMDVSEQHGQTSAFYFITDHSGGRVDGSYRMDHPLIRELLRSVHERGHEIGMHASYDTYLDAAQTSKELGILQQACGAEGIHQEAWGTRQHILRWRTPTTVENLDAAGFAYDTTLTFADAAGFRCGTCYEYPAFQVESGRPLRIRERPLVAMDATVLDPRYMGLGSGDGRALETFLALKDTCRFFSGDFTLLWHNNRMLERDEAELYRAVVAS